MFLCSSVVRGSKWWFKIKFSQDFLTMLKFDGE
jgi:hypothetical protein